MSSFNRKVENFLQLLGESYFTRNQALYSALLAIKNAFSLDETRNLQKLRKRRNNTALNFAQLGNKARKILDVVQTLQEQFSAPSAPRQSRVLPYVLATLLFLAPGFNKEAHAEGVKEGPKLAMNTKAPVLPEGSGTSVAPAAHTPGPEIEKAPCADMTACTRKEAYRASTNRIVLHYGEDLRIGARNEAESLSENGYPAIALPGGKPGQLNVFIDRGIVRHDFTQGELDNGRLGGFSMNLFDEKMAAKKTPAEKTLKEGDLLSLVK